MIQTALEQLEIIIQIAPQKLSEIDEISFNKKASPEKWSKKEILGHLLDSATNNHQRFIRAQFESAPIIWYDQNSWVEKSNYNSIETQSLISFWVAYNKHLIHIIRNIKTENLSNTCTLKDGVKVSLAFLVTDYVAHLEHHLRQIIDYN